MVQTIAQPKSIQFLHFSSLKTILQYLWHLRCLPTSKPRHLATQACFSLSRPVPLIFKIRIQWSSLTTKLHTVSQLFFTARAASITLHRLTQTKTIEIITMEIRCKVTIKDHMLREESLDDHIIITAMDSSTSSRCSCKLWIWVRACKSRCRHIIRTPTTIMLSSQIWWTRRTFSIMIKVLPWEITMDSRSSSWMITKCSLTSWKSQIV